MEVSESRVPLGDKSLNRRSNNLGASSGIIIVMAGTCQFKFGKRQVPCDCPGGEFGVVLDSANALTPCTSCEHAMWQHNSHPARSQDTSGPSTGAPSKPAQQSIVQPPIHGPGSTSFSEVISHLICPRDETVASLFERAEDVRVVYVRGTPACGKTILATLLRRYTEAHHPTIHVSQMSWAPDPDRTWDNILKFKCNITFNKQDFGTLRNHLIIVDEVQSSFNDVTFWSEFIKMLAQSRNRNWPMVVMFGSFGSPTQGPSLDTTPVDFPPDQRVSLQPNIEALPPPCSLVSQSLCLFFNRAEYEDTLRHAEKHTSLNNLPMTLAKDLQDHIWNLTYGHPGAVGAILKILDHHPRLGYFKVKGTQVPLEQALQIMEDTTSFSASLATTVFSRSWPRIPEIQADPKLALFLEEVVATRGLPANKKNTTEQRICHRNGWLHIEAQPVRTARGLVGTKVIYVFPTPLHHKLLEHHFFTPDFPKDRFKTVDDLLLASLKNFRRVNLREPHMRTGGRTPVEAQYQDELYRACWETFGQKLYLTSEYTPPEKKGRIDFFLESPKWGIECVRDGSQFNDHIRRFLPKHGQYCPWIESGLMEQFVLVDFRDTKPVIDPNCPSWVYYVIFSDSYKVCTVWDVRGKELTRFFTKV